MIISKNGWYKKAQSQSYDVYVVKEKDTLSGIAKSLLGNASLYTEIVKINPQITDPNKITPGMKINIPKPVHQVQPAQAVPAVQPNKTPSNIQKNEEQEKIKDEKAKPAQTVADPLSALKNEIKKGEGNYRSYNRGKAGDTPNPSIDITKMTVGAIMKMQNTRLKDGSRQLFAVGKYQMIPSTLSAAIADGRTGVTKEDLFTPETQEKLFMYLLYKRPKLMAYIEGKSEDIDAAINELAAEFASIPTTSGRGAYDGDKAKNKARGGLERVERIKEILKSIRNQ
jgi:hypothetical protein